MALGGGSACCVGEDRDERWEKVGYHVIFFFQGVQTDPGSKGVKHTSSQPWAGASNGGQRKGSIDVFCFAGWQIISRGFALQQQLQTLVAQPPFPNAPLFEEYSKSDTFFFLPHSTVQGTTRTRLPIFA